MSDGFAIWIDEADPDVGYHCVSCSNCGWPAPIDDWNFVHRTRICPTCNSEMLNPDKEAL